jgi:hypothetical protein
MKTRPRLDVELLWHQTLDVAAICGLAVARNFVSMAL